MVGKKFEKDSEVTIADVYPHFDKDQLKHAAESLRRYFEVTCRTCQRLWGQTSLTKPQGDTRIGIATPDPNSPTHRR
jgi:hypothetical protein